MSLNDFTVSYRVPSISLLLTCGIILQTQTEIPPQIGMYESTRYWALYLGNFLTIHTHLSTAHCCDYSPDAELAVNISKKRRRLQLKYTRWRRETGGTRVDGRVSAVVVATSRRGAGEPKRTPPPPAQLPTHHSSTRPPRHPRPT